METARLEVQKRWGKQRVQVQFHAYLRSL